MLSAPRIGSIDLAPGRVRFPRAGDTAHCDEPLFTIRGFKASADVTAPASGRIATPSIALGDFVEFGQPLATIEAT